MHPLTLRVEVAPRRISSSAALSRAQTDGGVGAGRDSEGAVTRQMYQELGEINPGTSRNILLSILTGQMEK
jgi:hypothetical protein